MKTKTIRFLLWLATVTVALVVLCITASAETYDNFFVGGVAVTTENESDIFGDGTASYDPAANTLTLRDYRHANVRLMRSDDGLEYTYSLFWGNDSDLIVDMSGDCLFPGGIRLERGAVQIHDATVTFGDYEALCCCVNIDRGALTVRNSRIRVDTVAYVMRTSSYNSAALAPFYAYQMLWEDSTLECSPASRSNNECNALLYAVSDMQIERCTLRVSLRNPKLYAALFSQSGSIVISDSDLSLSGVQVGILALGSENPYGDETAYPGLIELSRDEIIFNNGGTFAAASKALIIDSRAELYPYFDAMVVAGAGAADNFIIENTALTVTCNVDHAKRSAYLAGIGGAEAPDVTFGLYVTDASLSVKNATVTITDFDCAVGIGGDALLHLMKGADLTLKAQKAALVIYSFQPVPIVCDGESAYKQLNLHTQSQPIDSVEAYLSGYDDDTAERLSVMDLVLVTPVRSGKTVAYSDAPADLSRLVASLSGAGDTLYIYQKGNTFFFSAARPRKWVLPVILSLVAVAAVLTFVYFCFIRKGNVFRKSGNKDASRRGGKEKRPRT